MANEVNGEVEDKFEPHPGVEDGTVVTSIIDGKKIRERVVHDVDDEGNIIGSHKENIEVK